MIVIRSVLLVLVAVAVLFGCLPPIIPAH